MNIKRAAAFLTAVTMMMSAGTAVCADAGIILPQASQSASAYQKCGKVTLKSSYTNAPDAIRINWNADKNATGYKIYRYDTVTKKTVAAGYVWSGSTTTYRDSGLVSGRKYLYQVQAFNKGADGKYAFGTKSTPMTAYAKPATVKISSKYTRTNDAVRINWEKAYGATGYIIYRWNGKGWSRLAKVGANVTTYRDSKGLIAGGLYKYKVQSFKIDGKNVIYGNMSAVKGAATSPSSPLPLEIKKDGNSVLINWEEVKCDGYQLYIYKNKRWQLECTNYASYSTSHGISDLDPKGVYPVRIRAFRYDGTGASFGEFNEFKVNMQTPSRGTVTYKKPANENGWEQVSAWGAYWRAEYHAWQVIVGMGTSDQALSMAYHSIVPKRSGKYDGEEAFIPTCWVYLGE